MNVGTKTKRVETESVNEKCEKGQKKISFDGMKRSEFLGANP